MLPSGLQPKHTEKYLRWLWNFQMKSAGTAQLPAQETMNIYIEDIFVYPQEVTGSTVNTDQEEYTKWLYELDDEIFNKLRMQGHSHVNMSVSPSGVDDKHRQQILDQLEQNMFYIFMIWNKSLSVHTLVYDMARNILYEDDDVDIQLLCDDDTVDFLADAQEKVQKKSYNNKKYSGDTKKESGEQMSFCGDFDDFERGSLYDMYDPYYLGGSKWKL